MKKYSIVIAIGILIYQLSAIVGPTENTVAPAERDAYLPERAAIAPPAGDVAAAPDAAEEDTIVFTPRGGISPFTTINRHYG